MSIYKITNRFNYPYLNHMAHSGATVGFFSGLVLDPFGYRNNFKKVNGDIYTKKVNKKDWLASLSVPGFIGYFIGTYYPITFPLIGSYLIIKTQQWNNDNNNYNNNNNNDNNNDNDNNNLIMKKYFISNDNKTVGGNDI